MASGSSDDRFADEGQPTPSPAPEGGAAPEASPAEQRFLSCRWRVAEEAGTPAHCSHRDVLPMAGTTGFVAESWCPECAFYKAKRVTKKRTPERDDYWRS